MIRTENLTINGVAFVRTWSDEGYEIERDGVTYGEAIDPVDLGRTYTETDTKIDEDELEDAKTALKTLGYEEG